MERNPWATTITTAASPATRTIRQRPSHGWRRLQFDADEGCGVSRPRPRHGARTSVPGRGHPRRIGESTRESAPGKEFLALTPFAGLRWSVTFQRIPAPGRRAISSNETPPFLLKRLVILRIPVEFHQGSNACLSGRHPVKLLSSPGSRMSPPIPTGHSISRLPPERMTTRTNPAPCRGGQQGAQAGRVRGAGWLVAGFIPASFLRGGPALFRTGPADYHWYNRTQSTTMPTGSSSGWVTLPGQLPSSCWSIYKKNG